MNFLKTFSIKFDMLVKIYFRNSKLIPNEKNDFKDNKDGLEGTYSEILLSFYLITSFEKYIDIVFATMEIKTCILKKVN